VQSCVTSASDLPLHTNKFCSVLFSLAYSPMHSDLCHKQMCVVTVTHYCMEDVSCWSHTTAVIDRYPVIRQNCDLCLPHLHSTPPLGRHPVSILPWRLVWKK